MSPTPSRRWPLGSIMANPPCQTPSEPLKDWNAHAPASSSGPIGENPPKASRPALSRDPRALASAPAAILPDRPDFTGRDRLDRTRVVNGEQPSSAADPVAIENADVAPIGRDRAAVSGRPRRRRAACRPGCIRAGRPDRGPAAPPLGDPTFGEDSHWEARSGERPRLVVSTGPAREGRWRSPHAHGSWLHHEVGPPLSATHLPALYTERGFGRETTASGICSALNVTKSADEPTRKP